MSRTTSAPPLAAAPSSIAAKVGLHHTQSTQSTEEVGKGKITDGAFDAIVHQSHGEPSKFNKEQAQYLSTKVQATSKVSHDESSLFATSFPKREKSTGNKKYSHDDIKINYIKCSVAGGVLTSSVVSLPIISEMGTGLTSILGVGVAGCFGFCATFAGVKIIMKIAQKQQENKQKTSKNIASPAA